MTRFAITTAAIALATAPAMASDQATKAINQPGSGLYQEKPLTTDANAYGTAGLVGADVYAANAGVSTANAAELTAADVTKIGDVHDVILTEGGMMSGVLIDPVDMSDKRFWFVPASRVITVNNVEGTSFMINYSDDQMSEIERVERSNWE